jgi:hypothetical protein
MQFPSGLLNLDGSPTPALMDAIRHSETGHLNDAQAVGAVSKKDAIGPYQLLRKNLHQMGYKMPKNISEADATGIDTSRALAAKYVKGYNQHHNFTNPLHSLAAFNMGPTATAKWIEDGADFNKLPQETKDYVTRASVFLNQGQNDMMPNQTGALSTNNTAQLHPDLQADVAKMRNKKVPEDVISDYIAQRSQYYASFDTPKPALKGQDDEFVAPPLTKEQILNNFVENAPALTMQRNRPELRDPAEAALVEAMAQRDANPNMDDPASVPDGIQGALAQATAPTTQVGQQGPSLEAQIQMMNARNQPALNFNATSPTDGGFIGDDTGQGALFNPSMMAAGQSMQGGSPPASAFPSPALADDVVAAMDAARNQQDTFTSGSLGEQAPRYTESDNASLRPDASLLKEANDQLAEINASAGRRNNAILSTMPTQAIGNVGMRPNDMIRIGGAMVRGSAQGGLEAIGAATDEFGRIEDRDLAASGALQKALASGKGKGKANKIPPPVIENPVVTDNIDKLIPQLDEDIESWWPSNVAGLGGAILANIPGTEAHDFRARITTIKANIGFDKLQAMRDASPTGGALGQVSEKELDQLNASMGNLDNSQSPEQLRENLLAVRAQYLRTIAAINAQRQGYQQMQGGGGLTQSIQNLINTYAS